MGDIRKTVKEDAVVWLIIANQFSSSTSQLCTSSYSWPIMFSQNCIYCLAAVRYYSLQQLKWSSAIRYLESHESPWWSCYFTRSPRDNTFYTQTSTHTQHCTLVKYSKRRKIQNLTNGKVRNFISLGVFSLIAKHRFLGSERTFALSHSQLWVRAVSGCWKKIMSEGPPWCACSQAEQQEFPLTRPYLSSHPAVRTCGIGAWSR